MGNYTANDIIKLRPLRAKMRGFKAPGKIRRESKEQIKKYKDKYKGKRCFIIGNGPSLTAHDLELIKDEYSFAANRIYKIYDKTSWRPTFYCVQDINVGKEMGDDIKNAIDSADEAFFRMSGYESLKNSIDGSSVIYVPIVECAGEKLNIRFSVDADRYIYDGWTVTYMEMQLAAYMGFQEIYLIGVDCSMPFELRKNGEVVPYNLNEASHFYETPEDNKKGHERRTFHREAVIMGYQAAEDYSKDTGAFRIYNATRGGELEVFERVTLEDVLDEGKQNGEC